MRSWERNEPEASIKFKRVPVGAAQQWVSACRLPRDFAQQFT